MGKVTARIIGLGLVVFWTPFTYPYQVFTYGMEPEMLAAAPVCYLVALGVSCGAIMASRRLRCWSRSGPALGLAVAAMLGLLPLRFIAHVPMALVEVAVALNAAGTLVLFLRWAEQFCRVRSRLQRGFSFVAAALVSLMLLVALPTGLPEVATLTVRALAPCVSAGLLLLAEGHWGADSSAPASKASKGPEMSNAAIATGAALAENAPESVPALRGKLSEHRQDGAPLREALPRSYGLALFLFGVVMGLMATVSAYFTAAGDSDEWLEIYSLCMPLLALLSVATLRLGRNENPAVALFSASVLMLLGLTLFLLFGGAYALLGTLIVLVATIYLTTFAWTQFADFAELSGSSAATVFAFGMLALSAGEVLGIALGHAGPPAALTVSVAAFPLLYACFMLARPSGEPENAASQVLEEDEEYGSDEAIVRRIADRFALSPRETDVFLLLSRGWTLAMISEELYLSQNTVKSHNAAVYRKLGVHTRQDLLKLVEQERP